MSSLQDKMNKYEVAPPPGMWEKIAASLDESSTTQDLASRLYTMQQAPPVAVWDRIDTALHTEAPVVSMKRRAPVFIRYAAAAVLLGAVAFGVVKLTTGSQNTPGIAGTNPSADSGASKSITSAVPSEKTDNKSEPTDEMPIEQQKKLMAVNDGTKNNSRKINTRVLSTATYDDYNYIDAINDAYLNPIYAYEDPTSCVMDQYITVRTPEGKVIRMSKKLGSLICCVSGEEPDNDCKTQIRKWQQKLATSPSVNSSGNFLDVLNLVNSLGDNSTEL